MSLPKKSPIPQLSRDFKLSQLVIIFPSQSFQASKSLPGYSRPHLGLEREHRSLQSLGATASTRSTLDHPPTFVSVLHFVSTSSPPHLSIFPVHSFASALSLPSRSFSVSIVGGRCVPDERDVLYIWNWEDTGKISRPSMSCLYQPQLHLPSQNKATT